MPFEPRALPTLIGSLPMEDHREATRTVIEYMREIPLWVQLPRYREERLLSQFSEGLPGIRGQGDSLYFDTEDPAFENELLSFFEQYLAVTDGNVPIEQSAFAFSANTGRGFRAFLEAVGAMKQRPVALKGQITGPFTMLTGLKDKAGRLAYFNPSLREAVVKALALKARYQVEGMKALSNDVLMFLDEPALSGFGSSALVGIPREDVLSDLSEVIEAVHAADGLAGIHVCANTDWSLVLDAPTDILSFDAYSYFDRIVLFKRQLAEFLTRGKIMAWGLIPTLSENDLRAEDVAGLKARWDDQIGQIGVDPERIKRQSLITPSCGTGLLPVELSHRALALTRDLSIAIRS